MIAPRLLTGVIAVALVAVGSTSFGQGSTPTLPEGRVEIDVKDLHCKNCAKKVARKLYAVRGVKQVKSNLKKDLVTVTLTRGVTPEPVTLWTAVDAGGVKPVRLRHADQSLDADAMAPLLAEAGVELSASDDEPDH